MWADCSHLARFGPPAAARSDTVSWAHSAHRRIAGAAATGGLQGQATKLLLSVTDTVSTADLRTEVQDSTFLEYAERNYNLDRKGICRSFGE